MFDIGFSEIIICALVALVVIGPERMPEAVRTVGLWIGRAKRSLRETRSQIERQIGVDDIRIQLHNEEIMHNLANARKELESLISDTQASINSATESVTHEYTSEPEELPYHSHTNENTLPAKAAELTSPTIKIETAKQETLVKSAEVKTLASAETTSHQNIPLGQKTSL